MKDKTQQKGSGHRRYSKLVTETNARAASRGMLYGVGFKKGDFQKSQVGIASTWGTVTPCNMHINALAEHAARGVRKAKGMPLIFRNNYSFRRHINGNRGYEIFTGFT